MTRRHAPRALRGLLAWRHGGGTVTLEFSTMTMINPLAAALAAVLEQAVQAALQASNARLEAHIARLDAHVHQLDALADRVAALESSPATVLEEQRHIDDELKSIKGRLDELEETDGRGLTKDQVREIAESAAEEALDSHTSDYDHDEYDSHLQDDDRHPDSDIEDAVRSALNGTSVTLSF